MSYLPTYNNTLCRRSLTVTRENIECRRISATAEHNKTRLSLILTETQAQTVIAYSRQTWQENQPEWTVPITTIHWTTNEDSRVKLGRKPRSQEKLAPSSCMSLSQMRTVQLSHDDNPDWHADCRDGVLHESRISVRTSLHWSERWENFVLLRFRIVALTLASSVVVLLQYSNGVFRLWKKVFLRCWLFERIHGCAIWPQVICGGMWFPSTSLFCH